MRGKGDNERAIYISHAEMCKVLSHPKRLEIINTLRDKEMSVTELSQKLNVSMGSLSQHLSMMRARRILITRKEGNSVYYRLSNPKMLEAFDILREVLFDEIKREGTLIRKLKKEEHE